jgi:MHS family proline/betaine transporter-like MFS transporter
MSTEAPDPAAVKRHRNLFRAIERRLSPRLRRSDITISDERTVKRAVAASALGNAMEWFDFGVYAYLAVTIGKVFYSGASDSVQTLASFATFALSFLVRPLGGTFFGPLGDRIGRKRVLAVTIILMAGATFCVGLIPSYASIGFWAPLLLILCRLLQGFSTGGEYGGAATFIAEYAPDKRRGFYGSFLEMGTLLGYIFASGIVLILTETVGADGLQAWAWRVPFLIGGPIGVIGLYLRLKLDDTPAFQKLEAGQATTHATAGDRHPEPAEHIEASQKRELKDLVAAHWRPLALCIALVGAYNVTDYMLLSYMPTYLGEQLGRPLTMELGSIIIIMAAMILVMTFVGRLSDRVGRKPLLMAGMLGFLILTWPAFYLLKQGSWGPTLAGMTLLGASLVCLLGTMSATLPAMFRTDVRYGGLAIGYNISAAVFGGTTPLVMEALIKGTDNSYAPAWYTMLFAVIGIISVALLKETSKRPLEGSPPSVATKEEAEELARSQANEPTF